MLRRMVAGTLLLSMLMIAGCSGGTKDSDQGNQTKPVNQSGQTQQVPQPQTQTTEKPPQAKAVDIKGNFYETAIKSLVDKGVVELDNGKFYPDKPINRGEFIVWLNKRYDHGFPPVNPDKPTFPDLPKSHFAYSTIETLNANGIVLGYPDGTMKPDQPLTREETALVWNEFHRKMTGYSQEDRQNGYDDIVKGMYKDGKDVNPDYAIYIFIANRDYERVFGKSAMLKPKQQLIRAEAADFMSVDAPS